VSPGYRRVKDKPLRVAGHALKIKEVGWRQYHVHCICSPDKVRFSDNQADARGRHRLHLEQVVRDQKAAAR
jgi:hypothetical protein